MRPAVRALRSRSRTERRSSSRPRRPSVPRRSSSRSASRTPLPASTESPISSTALPRSYGGASGSGPPCQRPYRYARPGRLTTSGPVDRADAAGGLGQSPGQVEPFQRELDRGRRLLGGLLALRHPEPAEQFGELRDGAELAEQGRCGDQLAGLDGLAAGEVLLQAGEVQAGAARAEGLR